LHNPLNLKLNTETSLIPSESNAEHVQRKAAASCGQMLQSSPAHFSCYTLTRVKKPHILLQRTQLRGPITFDFPSLSAHNQDDEAVLLPQLSSIDIFVKEQNKDPDEDSVPQRFRGDSDENRNLSSMPKHIPQDDERSTTLTLNKAADLSTAQSDVCSTCANPERSAVSSSSASLHDSISQTTSSGATTVPSVCRATSDDSAMSGFEEPKMLVPQSLCNQNMAASEANKDKGHLCATSFFEGSAGNNQSVLDNSLQHSLSREDEPLDHIQCRNGTINVAGLHIRQRSQNISCPKAMDTRTLKNGVGDVNHSMSSCINPSNSNSIKGTDVQAVPQSGTSPFLSDHQQSLTSNFADLAVMDKVQQSTSLESALPLVTDEPAVSLDAELESASLTPTCISEVLSATTNSLGLAETIMQSQVSGTSCQSDGSAFPFHSRPLVFPPGVRLNRANTAVTQPKVADIMQHTPHATVMQVHPASISSCSTPNSSQVGTDSSCSNAMSQESCQHNRFETSAQYLAGISNSGTTDFARGDHFTLSLDNGASEAPNLRSDAIILQSSKLVCTKSLTPQSTQDHTGIPCSLWVLLDGATNRKSTTEGTKEASRSDHDHSTQMSATLPAASMSSTANAGQGCDEASGQNNQRTPVTASRRFWDQDGVMKSPKTITAAVQCTDGQGKGNSLEMEETPKVNGPRPAAEILERATTDLPQTCKHNSGQLGSVLTNLCSLSTQTVYCGSCDATSVGDNERSPHGSWRHPACTVSVAAEVCGQSSSEELLKHQVACPELEQANREFEAILPTAGSCVTNQNSDVLNTSSTAEEGYNKPCAEVAYRTGNGLTSEQMCSAWDQCLGGHEEIKLALADCDHLETMQVCPLCTCLGAAQACNHGTTLCTRSYIVAIFHCK
jgi:hypothetical protein